MFLKKKVSTINVLECFYLKAIFTSRSHWTGNLTLRSLRLYRLKRGLLHKIEEF